MVNIEYFQSPKYAASLLVTALCFLGFPPFALAQTNETGGTTTTRGDRRLTETEIEQAIEKIDRGKSKDLSDTEAELLVSSLREEHPFVSLRPRLEYELSAELDVAPMQEQDLFKFARNDYRGPKNEKSLLSDWAYSYLQRAESLRLLHTEEVRAFIARDGQGVNRGINPGVFHIRLPADKPLEFDKIPVTVDLSDVGAFVELPAPHVDKAFPQKGPIDNWRDSSVRTNADGLLPLDFVRSFHNDLKRNFLSPYRFGYVENLDRVSGFRGHAIAHRPESDPWDNRQKSEEWKAFKLEKQSGRYDLEFFFSATQFEERKVREELSDYLDTQPANATWLIRSMQLVSILKNNSPRVYVSEHFPNMEELRMSTTRDLDAFESSALQRLIHGDEVVIESRTNRIRMLGSIRGSTTCSACHTVPDKQLLGAFTYELVRNR